MVSGTSIKSLELLGVVHMVSYLGILLLELSQFPSPLTPCGVRYDVLVEDVVDTGMDQYLESPPEYQRPNLVSLHPRFGQVICTLDSWGWSGFLAFFAHGVLLWFPLYQTSWPLSTGKLLEEFTGSSYGGFP